MPLRVDHHLIGEDRIREEMQYHPAPSPDEARRLACDALIVRRVLLDQADRLGIREPEPISDMSGKLVEAPEEARIRSLIEAEISVSPPTDEECQAYYRENGDRFRSPDLLQASHILFAADPKSDAAMTKAKLRAETVLASLRKEPSRFPEIARELSDCSSGENGGDLGQVTRGSTIPEFETFLFALEPGQICPVPIRTRYGYHIARLNNRRDGRQLPFEAAKQRIAAYLQERSWRDAVRAYIARLVEAAHIEDMPPQSGANDGKCGDGCGCASAAGAYR